MAVLLQQHIEIKLLLITNVCDNRGIHSVFIGHFQPLSTLFSFFIFIVAQFQVTVACD